MKSFTSLLLCGLILCSSASHAIDSSNKFAMKGAGFLPCQVFITERQKKSRVYYMIGGWVEGYLSAYNKLTVDTYDIASFESLELFLNVIDKHCNLHPNDRLYGVLNALIVKISPDRLKRESTKIAISENKYKAQLYRETVKRIQFKLKALGLYKGQVDGIYTDETRSAIIAFQSDINYETTGFPDQSTLWRLLR